MAHRGDALGKDVCCIDDLKRLGSERMTPMNRDYYNGGAMDLISLRDNEAAFDRYKIRPRILVNVAEISTKTKILETIVSLPFGFSPAASHKLAHPDGELATSRAAAKFGICIGLSSYSTTSLEDVILEGQGNPYAIQMCVLRDRSLTFTTVGARREWAGYKAVFLSVDVPVLGHRLNEYRNDFRIPPAMSYPNILSNGADRSSRTDYDPTLPWLQEHTSMKIWLKGVMSPEDVDLAICHGADVPSTLDALRACGPAAKGKIPIAIDGGIRRGSDIFKALALGADYCFLGRVPVWGLAYDGQQGVELAIKILQMELKTTMALAGCRTVAEIQKSYLSVLRPDGELAKL
ncbi:FMN-dependent dehydrogenase family protein [Aspergillus insuetus]